SRRVGSGGNAQQTPGGVGGQLEQARAFRTAVVRTGRDVAPARGDVGRKDTGPPSAWRREGRSTRQMLEPGASATRCRRAVYEPNLGAAARRDRSQRVDGDSAGESSAGRGSASGASTEGGWAGVRSAGRSNRYPTLRTVPIS